MRLVIKGRGQGKTTELIHTSEMTGYPIITHNQYEKSRIVELAREINCIIPEPFTITELRCPEWRRGRNYPKEVLVDDVERILEEVLNEYLSAKVIGATMTDQIKEQAKRYEQTSKKEANKNEKQGVN